MGKIHVLDDKLANMIAAGEVVERPSSVVKELVENAIDAGSARIEVHMEEGGLQSIRVIDNGHGIAATDCLIAFERHATSKIQKERDLFRIHTLGFRGEALPSIAAVSRMELKSRESGQHSGTQVIMEAGKLLQQKTMGMPTGTEVIVRDLFFNTPARLKYMKTIQTEVGHVSDLLNRLAISHPDISFIFTHNGKTILKTAGDGKLLHVIASIYGTNTARLMVPIEEETIDFTIRGFVGKPEITRANRSYVTTIVNGRFIRNYALNQAVIRGYHTLLPVHRFPIAVLHLEMDPVLIDVNVHPSKLEIRFSKEQELLTIVEQTVRQSLQEKRLIPEITKPERKNPVSSFSSAAVIKPVQQRIDLDRPTQREIETFQRWIEPEKKMIDDKGEEGIPVHQVKEDASPQNYEIVEGQSQTVEKFPAPEERLPSLEPLAQLHGTYIIAQYEDGFYMIDQHAAQERINYEYFYKKLSEQQIESQELLVPITIELTASEAEILRQHRDMFVQVGVELEEFGTHTFRIRAYPQWIPSGEEEAVLREMIEMVINQQQINIGKLREETAINMSCKASIKANQHLTRQEMEALIDQLRQTENPFTCPHGRPITVHFSSYEIQKMFKRVM